MKLSTTASEFQPKITLIHSLGREVYLIWQFIWRDLSAGVIPGLLFSLAAARSNHLPISSLPLLLGKSLLYFLLYLSCFCIANQLTGLEEDRINKPTRPLVTGAVSVRGAQIRWIICMILFGSPDFVVKTRAFPGIGHGA